MKIYHLPSILYSLFHSKILTVVALVVPLIIVVLCVYLPFAETCITSLFSGRGASLEFVGLDNFYKLGEDPIFINALINTLIFSLIQTPLMIGIALMLSTSLMNISKKLQSILSVILLLPFVVSPVVYSIFFKNIFTSDGLVNNFLMNTGIIDNATNWLLNPIAAKIIIILACTWASCGYYVIVFSSALSRINTNIIDNTNIDGISKTRVFFKIKLPAIMPFILFSFLISFANSMQIFAETYIITGGGPGYQTISLMQYVYQVSFVNFPQFGYASSISFIAIIISGLILAIQLILMRKTWSK